MYYCFEIANFHLFQLKPQIFAINHLTVSDGGIYACYSNGKLVAEYSLIVLEPPFFVKKSQMQRLVVKPAGNTAKLTCKANGNPIPTVKWLKDGQEPKRNYGDYKLTHWSLGLEDLVTEDKGNYTCDVCNEAGCIDFTYRLDVVGMYQVYIFFKVNIG